MGKLLLSALLIFIIDKSVQAQLAVSIIGTTTIGADSLGIPAIGKATTQNCLTPGTCGSTCVMYSFTGAGNWSIEGNWEGNAIPPAILTGCSQILINPGGNAECILNIPMQLVPSGTSITVLPGKRFRIPGNVVNQ